MIPEENKKDLTEIPKNIVGKLSIHPIRWIDQVFETALKERPGPAVADCGNDGPVEDAAVGAEDVITKTGEVRAH